MPPNIDKELKYLLTLSDYASENVYEDLLYYFESDDKNDVSPPKFTPETLEFIQKNLNDHPYIITHILKQLRHSELYRRSENQGNVNKLVLDEINNLADSIDDGCNNKKHATSVLLFLITECQYFFRSLDQDTINSIIEKLHRIKTIGCAKELYLSLLSHDSTEMISMLSEYEAKNSTLVAWPLHPNLMIELCLGCKRHWLNDVIAYFSSTLESETIPLISNNFTKKIWQLVLINYINTSQDPDALSIFNKLKTYFSLVKTENSESSLNTYFNEIHRGLNLMSFCINNSKRQLLFSWNNMLQHHSALSIISQTCDLSQLDWFKVKQALITNNDLLSRKDGDKPSENSHWDVMTFNAYCIITLIIDVLFASIERDSEDATANIDKIKSMISNLLPLKYRMEILKNIFVCLFIRYEYFSFDDDKSQQNNASHSDCSYFANKSEDFNKHYADCRGFICRSEIVNNILILVKDCTVDMRNKHLKDTDLNLDEFKLFEEYVSNAICKWELVNSVKIEAQHLKCNHDFYNVDANNCDDENTSTLKRKKSRARKHRSKSYTGSLLSYFRYKKDLLNEPDFISLMLASSNTLLALCLETNDFSKAHKIIDIYDLSDTELYEEVAFTQQFLSLVDKIRSNTSSTRENAGFNQMEIATRMSVKSTAIVSLVEGFLSKHQSPQSYQLSDTNYALSQLEFDSSNYSIITIIDLLLSTGIDRHTTYGLLNIAEKKSSEIKVYTEADSKQYLLAFIRNMINIIYDFYQNTEMESNNSGICSILSDDKFPLKHKEYISYGDNLIKITNFCKAYSSSPNDLSTESRDCIIDVISKQRRIFLGMIFNDLTDAESEIMRNESCYLKYFTLYMENMAKCMQLQSNEGEDGVFDIDILNVPIYKIIGNLIDKHTPLDGIETVCKKLGINFIHKLVLNYCPSIKCKITKCADDHFDELIEMLSDDYKHYERSEDEDGARESISRPSQDVITHILVHNWVIANLVKKMHLDSPELSLQQSMDTRTILLDAYLHRDRFNLLKNMYSGSNILAALHNVHKPEIVRTYIEQYLLERDFVGCLSAIDALTEQTIDAYNLTKLRNHVLLNYSIIGNNWKYFLRISDVELQSRFVVQNLTSWDYEGVSEVLSYFAYHNTIDVKLRDECRTWLDTIPIYEKIADLIQDGNTWSSIYNLSINDPETILQNLLDSQQFELCLRWSYLHDVSPNVRNLVIQSLFRKSIQSNEMGLIDVKKLLEELPKTMAIDISNEILIKIKDINILKTVLQFLKLNSIEPFRYDNINIGIELLSEIEVNERVHFWNLITKPLLIIEQYLMNAKLDKLEQLLHKIKPMLKVDAVGDNIFYNKSLINSGTISINSVDALLRVYAEKALNLKSGGKNSEMAVEERKQETLLQSLDSINFIGESDHFIMPEFVPTKDKWVPDDFTNKCMICKETIFSILIRRHHCRRCGRLACYACSIQKIQIPGHYADIKVRVCNDCYKQTVSRLNYLHSNQSVTIPGSGSVNSDTPSLEWCLTTDPDHNDAVRKEFVYEFAPDVNLCLKILKMHSINSDYPRFLLDRSNELSRLASNSDSGVLELVQMRRALLVSCTVLYSRSSTAAPGLTSDRALAHTEHQLTITDATAHLALHRCHNMMPEIAMDSLDSHYVRKLLAAEKWDLALDISTKFGLSRTGILAAWGKACLKSGCFDQARQKFALCFKNLSAPNTSMQSPDQDSLSNYSARASIVKRVQRTHLVKTSSQSEFYRNKGNASLLDEIIYILETTNYTINSIIIKRTEIIKTEYESFSNLKSTKKMRTPEPALSVLHALASVHKIRHGDFSDFATTNLYTKKAKLGALLKKNNSHNDKYDFKPKIEPFFYNECIYYLTTYGSDSAIIKFYLKYENLKEALRYCCEHNVDKDEFTESIFIVYLNSDGLTTLLKTMYDMDNTWNIWTEYILHTCRELQHRGWLEALLKVQEGVEDHVRAAITCVGLFTRPTLAPHAGALHMRTNHLLKAKNHLLHVPKNSNQVNIQSHKTLILPMDTVALDKHINTINLQMEITSFLYKCEMKLDLTEDKINDVTPTLYEESHDNKCYLPTLFGSQLERIKLCVIVLVCGENLEDGFGTVVRVIKDLGLDAAKIFCNTTRYLTLTERFSDVIQLCENLRVLYADDTTSTVKDEVIEVSVGAIIRKCDSKGLLFDEVIEVLLSKTDNVSLKVSCYIESRILKMAYRLAIESNNLNDIKKVMREAERLGQTSIKNACLKKISLLNS